MNNNYHHTHESIEELVLSLFSAYHLNNWTFKWGNNNKTAIGTCNHFLKTIEISKWVFNNIKESELHKIEDVARHEVAHAITGGGHGS